MGPDLVGIRQSGVRGITRACFVRAHATFASTHDVERSNLGEARYLDWPHRPWQQEDLDSADALLRQGFEHIVPSLLKPEPESPRMTNWNKLYLVAQE